jgi:hypothetical protein
MIYAENTVTYGYEGKEYRAAYRVDGGVVSVMLTDGDGTQRSTSTTYVDLSTTDAVAKSLLVELLRDLGVF